MDIPFKIDQTWLVWLVPAVLMAAITPYIGRRIIEANTHGACFFARKRFAPQGPVAGAADPRVIGWPHGPARRAHRRPAGSDDADNVPVTVDAVVYFRVVASEAAVVPVETFFQSHPRSSPKTHIAQRARPGDLDEPALACEKSTSPSGIIARRPKPWASTHAVEVQGHGVARRKKRDARKPKYFLLRL